MKLTRTELKELIRQSMKEIDFKDQAAFDAYNKKHKMRKSTKVNVSGKDTTAGDASKKDTRGGDDGGFDVGGPSYPNVPKGAKTTKQAKAMSKGDDDFLVPGAGAKGDVGVGDLPDPSTRQGDPEANKRFQAKKAAQAKAKSMKGITNAWHTGENFEGFKQEFNDLQHKLEKKYGYGEGPHGEFQNLAWMVAHPYEDAFRAEYDTVDPEAKKYLDPLLGRYADSFSGPDTPEESITSQLRKEFKQYNKINKNLLRG